MHPGKGVKGYGNLTRNMNMDMNMYGPEGPRKGWGGDGLRVE